MNNVNAFIEESILHVKVMQTVYDKTGFSPRLRFVLKQFLYTASGQTDPWGSYAHGDPSSQGSPTACWEAWRIGSRIIILLS